MRGALFMVATITTLVGTALTATALSPTADADPATTTVRFDGATISVPASWPVYDLARDPRTCVRFDRHAVYLGHPGADQDCPAHLVGRTTALLIEPNDDTAAITPADPDSGTDQAVTGQVLLTASYGTAGASAAAAVIHAAAPAATAPTQPPQPAGPPTADRAAVAGHGYGFDTCAAPSAHAMHVWAGPAPYNTVGVYIGGINRACGDGNLSASWVRSVHSWGYHLIPTYVGRQAPCSGVGVPISGNPTLASSNGRSAAVNAVHAMQRLGLGPGNPVYLDLEQYDGSADCQHSVLRFVTEWVHRLHQSGYVAGVYTSNFGDLLARHDTAGFNDPDAIWIGRWNGRASVYGDPVVADNYWAPHRRLHQYRGPHNQRHGGVTINIDTDYIDGPVG